MSATNKLRNKLQRVSGRAKETMAARPATAISKVAVWVISSRPT